VVLSVCSCIWIISVSPQWQHRSQSFPMSLYVLFQTMIAPTSRTRIKFTKCRRCNSRQRASAGASGWTKRCLSSFAPHREAGHLSPRYSSQRVQFQRWDDVMAEKSAVWHTVIKFAYEFSSNFMPLIVEQWHLSGLSVPFPTRTPFLQGFPPSWLV